MAVVSHSMNWQAFLAYRDKFSGKYEYRLITGGVGHNLPQEAPQAFAQAVADVGSFS